MVNLRLKAAFSNALQRRASMRKRPVGGYRPRGVRPRGTHLFVIRAKGYGLASGAQKGDVTPSCVYPYGRISHQGGAVPARVSTQSAVSPAFVTSGDCCLHIAVE
jgi:hypothetical protein